MSQKLNKQMREGIKALDKGKATIHQATVDDPGPPLTINMGGGTGMPVLALESAGPLAAGDRVNVAMWRNNALVIGKATDDPQGSGSGGGGTYTAGSGLGESPAGTFNVNAGTGLEVSADNLRIAAAAAGDGLSGGGGSALAVNVDGSTIETSSDALRLKDGGTTRAKLHTELKPSGSAGATDESLRRLGTGSTHAMAGDDARAPTTGQKNALAGAHGTPGTGTEYLTKASLGTAGTAGKALEADKSIPESQVTNLTSDLALKAPLASPVFTGNPTAPTPVVGDNDTSIATTAFVQAQIDLAELGFLVKDAVGLVTASSLPANTLVGTTLTANANGDLSVTQYSASTGGTSLFVTSGGTHAGMRVLVTAEADQKKNGLYYVANGGSGATKWSLVRASDFDEDAEIEQGTVIPHILATGPNVAMPYWQLTTPSPVIGTSNLVFSRSTAFLDEGAVDNSTVELSSGVLRVKDDGITAAKIAANAVGNSEMADNAILAAEIGSLPACRVYNSANISIPNNAVTRITFNSERFDTDTMHSTGANTGRITATTAGLYLITLNVNFASNATGYREVSLVLNGTWGVADIYATGTFIADDARPAVNGKATGFSISTLYKLAAGDYVEAAVTQTSTAALNVTAGGNYSPEFSATWVGEG